MRLLRGLRGGPMLCAHFMTTQDNLLIERHDTHVWIRFNRAEKANALTPSMMEDAAAAVREAVADDAMRAVLFTGAGERVFCAGADVREKPAGGDAVAHRARRGAALFALLNALIDCPKPVITALNGVASGGGAMLALVSDARVAVDTAELSLPEINLGAPTFTGATIALHVGGLLVASDLVQTGRRMPAAEALAKGLLTSIVPRDQLHAEATRTAATLVQKDAAAFAANKRWLNRGLKAALAEASAEHAAHRKL